jgi:hypothetical protein
MVGLAAACGSTDTTTGTTNGHVADAAANGGSTNGAGGSSAMGGSTTGTGGTADCPPECFVNNRCVVSCTDTPRDFGCCPCPAGMINFRSCGAPSGGAGGSANGAGGSATGAGGATSGTGSCDAQRVRCRSLPPTCPSGQAPSVDGICWGPCVAIETCTCAAAADCPDPDHYTCHMSAGMCGPYI